jgi:hypothetical protein
MRSYLELYLCWYFDFTERGGDEVLTLDELVEINGLLIVAEYHVAFLFF